MDKILLSNCLLPVKDIERSKKGYFSVFTYFNPETGEITSPTYHYNPSLAFRSDKDTKKFNSFEELKDYISKLSSE
jgi:hypothetical protein